jgi:hypothetical protein
MSATAASAPSDVVLFAGCMDPNAWLSPFTDKGVVVKEAGQPLYFPTLMHWIACQSAVRANDFREALAISDGKRGELVPLKHAEDAKWVADRERVLLSGVALKAKMYPEEVALLLKVANGAVIGFACPEAGDLGTGLSLDHPDAANPAKWTKKNLLGEAWMKLATTL